MWCILWALALAVAAGQVCAETLTSKGAPRRSGATSAPEIEPGSGRARPTPPAPAASSARSTSTPFALSGQTICSPGTVDERPPDERASWFDGATVGLPGHRCITLQ